MLLYFFLFLSFLFLFHYKNPFYCLYFSKYTIQIDKGVLFMNHYNICEISSTKPSQKSFKIFIALCLLTYFFNCTDLLFTYTYLKTGYFYEFNPLMQPFVSIPSASIAIKIITPALLLTFILNHLSKTTPKLLKSGIIICAFITLFYFLINCMHICYFFYIL